MTQDDLQYWHDQYFLAIVNDVAWYLELHDCLNLDHNFKAFANKVDYMIERLRSKHCLVDCANTQKVYIRLMALEYLLSPEMIRAKFGDDDIFCKHISFCHREGLGWLAGKVLRAAKTTPEAINGQPETQLSQENNMASIEIKNITFINNVDVTTLTDEQLIDSIKNLEAEIAGLQAVKTESTKVKAKIAALEDTLTKVVAILDAR